MAGFNTAVTGLKSASQMLDVAGNNIANSSTVGFKSTRTEFSDIYATSVVGAGASNQPGSGVTVSDISQDFSAGTIEFTNNNLDLAINGSGFFQLNDGQGGITYTRAGSFELDKDGNIVSKNGKFLQGYGLDEQGNSLPIQNLAVTQKESSPKGTASMELSINIDSAADAEELARTFDRANPASYTYSTTVETVDTLGNSGSIRFYFVEQAAVRETYSYVFDSPIDSVTLSGVTFNPADPDPAALAAARVDLEGEDTRIDPSTLAYDISTRTLSFEFKADSTQLGDVEIVGANGVTAVASELTLDERTANEVQRIPLSSSFPLTMPSNLSIAGVAIPAPTGTILTQTALGEYLESFQKEILEANPDIESVSYQLTSESLSQPHLAITYKANAGAQDNIAQIGGTANLVFNDGGDGLVDDTDWTVDVGDNTYIGTYRLYAYLDDVTQLDLGKLPDPGSDKLTTTNPILVKFDPTSGQLSSVNGGDARGGNAPTIEITGADPEADGPIALDITGSSQFASESIVKAASQDGYPKGDLIGVSFAETGEMVASFSNGQRQNLGLVAIASFENQDGLRSAGSTEWISTLNSGSAILNPPGTGLNGTLRSAALESSNVDLSAELVKLIEAQRNFQANSKTLETQNTVTQAILQI